MRGVARTSLLSNVGTNEELPPGTGFLNGMKRGNFQTLLNGMTGASFCGLVFFGAAGKMSGADGAGVRSDTVAPSTNRSLHEVVIKRPAGPPGVATGLTNFHGQPAMASCRSCHATTTPNIDTRTAAELDQFHQGLKYVHGNLTCLSCHNAKNYDTLRLADSRPVEFTDVMTLCSQCHGSQRRDYNRGLHGGMNGHWDLTRGGRTRNTCINCHDPHAPAFPL